MQAAREGKFCYSDSVTSKLVDLLSPADASEMINRLQRVIGIISSGDRKQLTREIPDSRLSSKAMAFLRSAVPAAGSGYRLRVLNGAGQEIWVEPEMVRQAEGARSEPTVSSAVETMTGRLSGISFDDQRVTIIYAPLSRSLDCVSSEDIEVILLENRRDLIQVTGQVLKDADGHPEKIIEVEAIEELDMSPIHLNELKLHDGGSLRFRERLALQPILSDTEQLLS